MGYTITLRRMEDGLEVVVAMDREWNDHERFRWSEWNLGCDCNRAIYFNDPENTPCGESLYRVVRALSPEGVELWGGECS